MNVSVHKEFIVKEPGIVEHLWVSPGKHAAMQACAHVEAIVDQGFNGCGHGGRKDRQVLLVEAEALAEVRVTPGVIKENITTSGIALRTLPAGTLLQLGDQVTIEISQACEPCALMDKIRRGLRAELQGRRGMLGRVRLGGVVAVGDAVRVVASA